jgi:pimeloyl-ACP methyl ester carboxylesterase
MPYTERGRSRLYYETHGEGPAVVLAHGAGGNHISWHNQVPTFAQNYRVITIDQRGFCNSTDEEGFGRAAMTDDLLHVLDELDIDRAALVAQSMGGGTCCGLACTHPDRVSALVMCDTVLGIALPPDLKQTSLAGAAAARALSTAERVIGPRLRRDDPIRVFLYLQLAGLNRYGSANLPGDLTEHTPEQLAATGIPILFVVGSDDVRFPASLVHGVHKLIPGSKYVEIPEAGHSAYFESPALFNRHVLDFLAPHERSRDIASSTSN